MRGLGFWRHLPEDRAAHAEDRVAAGGFPFALSEGRENVDWFFVDGETMAEWGVARELEALKPALHSLGVELRIENVDRTDQYVVTINGRTCVVWTPQDDDNWTTATVRPLAVVNELLAEAGAVPRFCTLYAGANDGIAWLLDPRIVAAVAGSGLLPDRETPAPATLTG